MIMSLKLYILVLKILNETQSAIYCTIKLTLKSKNDIIMNIF